MSGANHTNSTNSEAYGPLIEAIAANSTTDVVSLLEAGASVNTKDDNGYTPLMRSKSSEMTSLLLTAGATANAKDDFGCTPLMHSKSSEMMSLLLKAGAYINAKDNCGQTALILSKSSETTERLLAAGADVNAKDNSGRTALMSSKSSEMTSLLLAAGASRDYVNARDIFGRTALIYSNSSEMTALLLAAGANVNAKNIYGETALMKSKSSGMTSLLLAAGADINAKDNYGFTALMNSKSSEITSLLLAAGAGTRCDYINIKDNDGNTSLMYAINSEDKKKVQCLLAHGADTNTKNVHGETALDKVLYTCSSSLVTLVLASGAKLEKEDRVIQQWLEPPRQGKKEKIALLLAAGARHRLNLPAELEPTPQDLAEADDQLRDARAELAAARSRVSFRAIRGRAVQVCIALQGLGLPALVTLHILEELDEKARSVRMGALWALIVAVKHSRPKA